jgi:trehalose 6-phosphate synthase/phosphatase
MCRRGDVTWVGWPGETTELESTARDELSERLREHRLEPVYLSREEVASYYEEIANGVLWPALHGQIGELPPAPHGWDSFVAVNERFAQTLLSHYGDGDVIWVQDFHLALVPGMLRRRLERAAIGYFLHTPFPAYEVFSILPWREQLLEGLLGSDLIGFHTEDHLRNFADAAHRLLGLEVGGEAIMHRGRRTQLGVFPMGIDATTWDERSKEPEILRKVDELRREASGRNLILGIDRLDYTKGILRRFLTVERLLQMDERLSDSLRFIQVTVPSRQKVGAYANLERQIDEMVGRVNARYTSATAVPIHRLHRAVSEEELSVLYRSTDVMFVTPLRDGMNLVAKEFVASRSDEDGVLILSEFAGAAAELPQALLVNPYDIDGTASVVLRALTMPREERQERMRGMRQRVFEHDVRRWTDSFLDRQEQSVAASQHIDRPPSILVTR